MRNIALSYRRADSQAMAGRIHDELIRAYGSDDVFMDIDAIPLGMDFSEEIEGALAGAKVLLVIIGRVWLGPRADGPPRIMDPTDPVRLELETAMKLRLPIVPVLVDGAEMPGPGDLPPSLERFSYRQACKVDSGIDFQMHMGRLMKALDRFVAEPAASSPEQPSSSQRQPPRFGGGPIPAGIGVAAAGVATLAPPSALQPSPVTAVQASSIAVGEAELAKWSWGPFLLWWLWPWWNGDTTLKVIALVLVLVSWIPVVGFIGIVSFAIYLGINGNRLMIKNRAFQSYEQFVAVKTAWAKAGVIVFGVSMALGIIAAIIAAASGNTSG